MLSPKDICKPEKRLWTEADFEQMGWHDVTIHALTFAPEANEIILDIDYIFAWVEPEPPSAGYTFWVSPATLVFRNVHELEANFGDPLGLEIAGITREGARVPKNAAYIEDPKEWTWTIDLVQGEFGFSSVGFSQFTRREPEKLSAQCFSLEARGGISFDRPQPLIP